MPATVNHGVPPPSKSSKAYNSETIIDTANMPRISFGELTKRKGLVCSSFDASYCDLNGEAAWQGLQHGLMDAWKTGVIINYPVPGFLGKI